MQKTTIEVSVPTTLVRAVRALSRWQVMLLGSLLGAAITGTVAFAVAPGDEFKPHEPLTAKALNDRFDALHDELVTARPVYKNGGKMQYLDATVCGTTGLVTGNLDGYDGANQLCVGASGCNGAATAHMCTATEILRFVGTGGVMPAGDVWFSTGVMSDDGGGFVRDCRGWSSASVSDRANYWSGPIGHPLATACDVSNRVVCCD